MGSRIRVSVTFPIEALNRYRATSPGQTWAWDNTAAAEHVLSVLRQDDMMTGLFIQFLLTAGQGIGARHINR